MTIDLTQHMLDANGNPVPNGFGRDGESAPMTTANLLIMACNARSGIDQAEIDRRRAYIGLIVGDSLDLTADQATDLAAICASALPESLASVAAGLFA
jgi:hypothetical protein